MQMDPELGSLEYVGNFQRFETPKTIDNITKWMNDSFKALKVQHSDFNQLSADGAANSIGSIAEYEALARTSRPNNVDVDICISHQNQRSGGLASGTLDFAVPENQELGDLLNKNHLIQTFISRSTGRMATYKGVQRKKVAILCLIQIQATSHGGIPGLQRWNDQTLSWVTLPVLSSCYLRMVGVIKILKTKRVSLSLTKRR